jgi:hypothetical protein
MPPPPSGGMPDVIPWEQRARYGFAPALIETVKMFVTTPAEAWRRTPEKGEIVNPLLFALIVSWVGAIFSGIWMMFFGAPWLRLLRPELRDRLPMAGRGIGQVIFAPIVITIGLFLASAILHLCLMAVGGLSSSTSGFDGTFRALAYSAVADLANVVPVAGGMVAAIWKIVLVVMGFVALHRTTQGKAITAVLIPVAVCCVCGILATTVFFGLLFGGLHR